MKAWTYISIHLKNPTWNYQKITKRGEICITHSVNSSLNLLLPLKWNWPWQSHKGHDFHDSRLKNYFLLYQFFCSFRYSWLFPLFSCFFIMLSFTVFFTTTSFLYNSRAGVSTDFVPATNWVFVSSKNSYAET